MHDISTPEALLVDDNLPPRQRPLLASLISAVIPGLGHILVGRKRKACVLLVLLFALMIGFWPLRLLRFPSGLAALAIGWLTLYVIAPCDVATTHPVGGHKLSKWWLLLVVPIALVAASATFDEMVKVSGFHAFSIPSPSMENTVRKGDQVIVDTRCDPTQAVQRQQIIAFSHGNVSMLKRVVAVGGDTVIGLGGGIYVNGTRLDEPYALHRGQPPIWMENFGPIKVPNGSYFVLGDNRDVSFDSRSPELGPVSAHAVVGVMLYVLHPRALTLTSLRNAGR